jgi:hypothetical protein
MKKFGNNTWETPIGKVVDGMSALRALYSGYGELKPVNENGPDAFKIKYVGRSYVEETFPLMDHFKRCHVEIEGRGPKRKHGNGAASVEDEMRYGRATLEMRKLSAAMTLAEGRKFRPTEIIMTTYRHWRDRDIPLPLHCCWCVFFFIYHMPYPE